MVDLHPSIGLSRVFKSANGVYGRKWIKAEIRSITSRLRLDYRSDRSNRFSSGTGMVFSGDRWIVFRVIRTIHLDLPIRICIDRSYRLNMVVEPRACSMSQTPVNCDIDDVISPQQWLVRAVSRTITMMVPFDFSSLQPGLEQSVEQRRSNLLLLDFYYNPVVLIKNDLEHLVFFAKNVKYIFHSPNIRSSEFRSHIVEVDNKYLDWIVLETSLQFESFSTKTGDSR